MSRGTALWRCHSLTVSVFLLPCGCAPSPVQGLLCAPAAAPGSSCSLCPDQSQGWDQGDTGLGWAGLAGVMDTLLPQCRHHGHSLGSAAECPTVAMGQPLPKDKPFPREGTGTRSVPQHGSLAKGAQHGSFPDPKGGEAVTSAIQVTPPFLRDYLNFNSRYSWTLQQHFLSYIATFCA